ncbi:MAG: DUF11 domain-containing protein [Saprospiraceae bacterium]|nr:DUF11 domain-containing protein [Saprospiraceae bacterium]
MKQILFVVGLILCSVVAVQAQGWQRIFDTPTDSISGLIKTIQTRNGGSISVGYVCNARTQPLSRYEIKHNANVTWSAKLYIAQVDRNGDLLRTFTIDTVTFNASSLSAYNSLNLDIVEADSGRSYIVTGACTNPANPKIASGFMLKMAQTGQMLWFKRYDMVSANVIFTKIHPLSNDTFLIIGNRKMVSYFLKINTLGDSLWSSANPNLKNVFDVLEINNTHIEFLTASDTVSTMLNWVKTDLDGNIQQHEQTGLISIQQWIAKKIDDETYLQLFGTGVRVTKRNGALKKGIGFNMALGSNYTTQYPLITKTQDKKWLAIQQLRLATDSAWRMYLTKFDTSGQIIFQKIITSRESAYAGMSLMSIATTNDGGFLICGSVSVKTIFSNAILLHLDSNGDFYTNTLTGKIYNDVNRNCQYDNELNLKNWLIKAENTRNGDVFWGLSDTLGIYSLNVDTGNFNVKAIPPNANWQPCTPSVLRTFSQFHTSDTTDFGIRPLVNCPVLSVDMSTPFLRRCMNNLYSVRYVNNGTVAAQNAYITVLLDPLMRFESSSRPLSNRVGNMLRFNLGTVDINQSGNFTITASIICGDSTQLGQTLCSEAHIYPDSVCVPISGWSGANIEVVGSCGHDSVRFNVRNRGTAPSQNLRSVVVEDQVLFLNGRVQLNTNQNQVFAFPANGSTWRMTVEQEPNHPTSHAPTAVVEGCGRNSNGGFSMGFVTMFDNDDADPAKDVDCQQIIGSYDPNDKTGYPIGYDFSKHYINQNQDIEYVIRFQNTGTDTAFIVVVRDTLPPQLDIESLTLGASSHSYKAEIYNKNVLKFTFDDIRLVDSFRNEAASHGFVKFRIKQKKDLPLGTLIENSAAIYFDFNEPVLTEKAWHTIGKNWLTTVSIEKPVQTDIKIKVFPNPLSETAIFELENAPLSIEAQFLLFDTAGKLIRAENIKSNRFEFERRDLPSCLYLFKIENEGKIIGSGKLMVD